MESNNALLAIDNLLALIQNDISSPTKKICNVIKVDLNQCYHIQALHDVITNYISIEEMNTTKVVDILNHFNHFLFYHNKDDVQFECIYNLFGSCNPQTCNKIQRNYRNRLQINPNSNEHVNMSFEDAHSICIDDILNKIHCHIYHQFDIGYRLNNFEQKQIPQIVTDIDNTQFQQLAKIFQARHSNRNKYSQDYKNSSHKNKFVSDLNQITISDNDESKENKENMPPLNYSYGFPFNYKQKFKTKQEQFLIWKYYELYIP
eukprot:529165_1